MRGQVILAVLLLAALCSAEPGKGHHRRRHRRLRTTTSTAQPPLSEARGEEALVAGEGGERDQSQESGEVDLIAQREMTDEKKYQEAERERIREMKENMGDFSNDVIMEDPCLHVHCSAGRVCDIDERGEAVCNCIRDCPYETDHRRMVCTNQNETWSSDCEVYRQHCLCLEGSELCRDALYNHVQIEYYGACREMPECTENDMLDFPRRMREWLFNTMRELAERSELPAKYRGLEREAETDLARRWTNAAVWKWCDLNAHDDDRFVSRHELFPIRAPLMSLEHCIAPFLDACDADNDHNVSLHEWAKCLEIEETELEDRCEQFTEDTEDNIVA